METVTLLGEDFKILHNTLCDLRNLVDRMDRSLINTREFDRIIEGLEMGLKRAYDQDEDAFDRKHAYYTAFKRDNGLTTIWSIFDLPVHGFLEDHPWQGAATLVYHDHTTATIDGPTWADLYRAADQVIQRSGDQHHCFIEGFGPVAKQPHQLRLTTGS